jgi:hypothetical protein
MYFLLFHFLPGKRPEKYKILLNALIICPQELAITGTHDSFSTTEIRLTRLTVRRRSESVTQANEPPNGGNKNVQQQLAMNTYHVSLRDPATATYVR